MKAHCAPSSGGWKSAPSCVYLLHANLSSPLWHAGNLCYRAHVSKASASERLFAPCLSRLGCCASFHWFGGFWMWVLCAFSKQHIVTFLRIATLFWTCIAHLSCNQHVETSPRRPHTPSTKIVLALVNPHRVRGSERGMLSCVELGTVGNQRKGGFGLPLRLTNNSFCCWMTWTY